MDEKVIKSGSNLGQRFYSSRNPSLWLIPVLALFLFACNTPGALRFIMSPTPASPAHNFFPQQPTQPAPTPAKTNLPAYQPSAGMIQLANDAAMTAKGRDLFFSARPEIDTDRITFERHCQTQVMKNTVELGCYTTENRIYILKLDDPRLNGEMAVTAAHEMLHVAYEQLSSTDQTMVDGLLENAVAAIQDAGLLQRLKAYRALEPGQRDNELHSILGTEYPSLGNDLEQYYSLYFSDDRRAVVNAAQQFNQIFSQQEAGLTSLANQIKQMRNQMELDLTHHDNAAYNHLVPQINALIKQYNQAVHQYNALSRELLGNEAPASTQP